VQNPDVPPQTRTQCRRPARRHARCFATRFFHAAGLIKRQRFEALLLFDAIPTVDDDDPQRRRMRRFRLFSLNFFALPPLSAEACPLSFRLLPDEASLPSLPLMLPPYAAERRRQDAMPPRATPKKATRSTNA